VGKLRVCQICSGDLWAGKESVCAILVRGLVEMDDIEVTGIVFNEGRLARELREAGIRVDVVDETRLGTPAMLRRVKEIFRETRPDVVHAHAYKEHFLGAFAVRSCGACVIRTFHGMPEPRPFWAWVRGWICHQVQRFVTRRMTDTVVVVSKDMERQLQGRTGRAKLAQIYNGIELDRLPKQFDRPGLLRELGLAEDVRLVGAVGRLVPVKGLNYLLNAAAIVALEHPEMHFLIVGDGPSRGKLERQARELGIEDHVHFLGHRDDATNIIGCLDVLAMPSLHEGIPMTLLEARAMGVGVVASGVGGIKEVLVDDHGACEVRPDQVERLATVLIRVCSESSPLQRQRSWHSSKEDNTQFGAVRMAAEYREVFGGAR
jgi:glycosyltransferase involved in cell wall biosynthesis